jgi:hypothetical protein
VGVAADIALTSSSATNNLKSEKTVQGVRAALPAGDAEHLADRCWREANRDKQQACGRRYRANAIKLLHH